MSNESIEEALEAIRPLFDESSRLYQEYFAIDEKRRSCKDPFTRVILKHKTDFARDLWMRAEAECERAKEDALNALKPRGIIRRLFSWF